MSDRYKVLPGSQSGHCCFDATVVDTHTPQKRWHGEEPRYEAVCECFDPADAELVKDTLNNAGVMLGHPPLMTAAEVNALPPKAREYIHQLVANTDPAGMVRENMQLIDTNKGLQAMYRSTADDRDRMREVLERVKTGMEWTRDGVPAEQGWSRADDEMLAEIDNVLAGSKPTPQQKHIGYMVCVDGRYMYWPVEDLQWARTHCEDNVEPVKLMADVAELNKHEEGQV